jgi:hypothetical protein
VPVPKPFDSRRWAPSRGSGALSLRPNTGSQGIVRRFPATRNGPTEPSRLPRRSRLAMALDTASAAWENLAFTLRRRGEWGEAWGARSRHDPAGGTKPHLDGQGGLDPHREQLAPGRSRAGAQDEPGVVVRAVEREAMRCRAHGPARRDRRVRVPRTCREPAAVLAPAALRGALDTADAPAALSARPSSTGESGSRSALPRPKNAPCAAGSRRGPTCKLERSQATSSPHRAAVAGAPAADGRAPSLIQLAQH